MLFPFFIIIKVYFCFLKFMAFGEKLSNCNHFIKNTGKKLVVSQKVYYFAAQNNEKTSCNI